jgi:hypothetical protein
VVPVRPGAYRVQMVFQFGCGCKGYIVNPQTLAAYLRYSKHPRTLAAIFRDRGWVDLAEAVRANRSFRKAAVARPNPFGISVGTDRPRCRRPNQAFACPHPAHRFRKPLVPLANRKCRAGHPSC